MRPLALTGIALAAQLAACLDFAPPPEPVAADTSGPPACGGGDGCSVGDRCLALGQQAPLLAPCQVCGPDDAMLPCPFACGDGDRCAAVVDLDAGLEHACVTLDTGAVWCWGAQDDGAIGDGVVALAETTPVASAWPGPTDALAVSIDNTCVLSGGDVFCWGGNAFGQSGRAPSPAEPEPGRIALPGRAVSLGRAAASTPCATLEDGGVWCWGFVIDGRRYLAAGPDAGTHLPYRVVAPGPAGVEVATGSGSACWRDAEGALTCWGDGAAGALGVGSTEDHPDGVAVATLAGESATALVVGDGSACVVVAPGEVRCWGFNAAGQAGVSEDDQSEVLAPRALDEPPLEALEEVDQGFRHTCALGVSDRVFCWGLRTQAQCGATFLSPSHAPTAVPGLPPVARIATGGSFTCALGDEDGLVWCFGRATRGELGRADLDAPTVALPVLAHKDAVP